MLIEGTHTLQASTTEVWQALTGQESLSKTLPGIEYIEPISTGETKIFGVALSIQQGPFTGRHLGRLTISKERYPLQYHLEVESEEQESFQAACTVQLQAQGQTTIVTYHGTLTSSKVHSLRTQKIVKGAIKYLLQEYFLQLTERLYTQSNLHVAMGNTTENVGATILRQARGNIAILPQSLTERKVLLSLSGWWHMFIAWLSHLIWKDAQQQALWLKRARQIGTIGSIIALIWIGTRIPRRP